MRSLNNYDNQPASIPLLADDILEFHAARLILLFKLCGKSNRIDGLTKMAKLDFFVRYPQFFTIACNKLGIEAATSIRHVESSMIRFHYGPWDNRYYHILSYIEAKQIIRVTPHKNMYRIELTELGDKVASRFAADPAYSEVARHMKLVKKVLGDKTGSSLKNFIYQLFEDEVVKRSLGEVIG